MKRIVYSRLLACLLLAGVSPAEGEVRRALVIGVSEYPNFPEAERLKYADQDAQSFGDFLKTDDAGKFEVTTLLNGKATKSDIWSAVEGIKREPVPDTLFVFFSGHAELESRTKILYLMPNDGDKKILPANGISADEFLTHLKAVGPTNLIVFLDACRSGAAILGKGNDIEAKIAETLDDTIARLNKENNGIVMVFASAASNEKSWEDDQYKARHFYTFSDQGIAGRC